MRAISLLSGGLDSVVATWSARDDHVIAAAMTFDYGQRARDREVAAARAVAGRIGCDHLVVELPWLARLGGNALTDETVPVPRLAADDLDNLDLALETARAVWVPNRNGVFLNVAAAYAEALDCDALICGFNAEEAVTFADNSRAFMDAASRFFELSTLRHPRVISPTVALTKPQIASLGARIGTPFGLVWSCYHAGPEHCWECESCRRLRRALETAGLWESWSAGRLG